MDGVDETCKGVDKYGRRKCLNLALSHGGREGSAGRRMLVSRRA